MLLLGLHLKGLDGLWRGREAAALLMRENLMGRAPVSWQVHLVPLHLCGRSVAFGMLQGATFAHARVPFVPTQQTVVTVLDRVPCPTRKELGNLAPFVAECAMEFQNDFVLLRPPGVSSNVGL